MNKALFIISLFSVKLLDTMFSVKLKHKTYCYQQVLYYSVGTFHWICFTVVAAGIVRYTFTVHRQNTNTNSSTIQWHHQLWKVIHMLKSQITLISTCQDCAGSALKVDQYSIIIPKYFPWCNIDIGHPDKTVLCSLLLSTCDISRNPRVNPHVKWTILSSIPYLLSFLWNHVIYWYWYPVLSVVYNVSGRRHKNLQKRKYDNWIWLSSDGGKDGVFTLFWRLCHSDEEVGLCFRKCG